MVGDLLLALGQRVVGYVDRDAEKLGQIVDPTGAAISHLEDDLLRYCEERGEFPIGIDACALGIGDNRTRQDALVRLGDLDSPPLVHPSATVGEGASIGRGTVIFPLAVVNTGARIADAVIVNSGSIVEHDCTLESGVHVSPGAVICGGSSVGERSWIGAGATVIHGVRIGKDVVVGAGSTVIEEVADEATVVGSPARPIDRGPDPAERSNIGQ